MTIDSLYRLAVDERYRVLRHALLVAVSRPDWGLRMDQIETIRAEIRALVRVRWFARREFRADRRRREAVMGLAYHDWQRLPETIAEVTELTERDLFQGYGLRLS